MSPIWGKYGGRNSNGGGIRKDRAVRAAWGRGLSQGWDCAELGTPVGAWGGAPCSGRDYSWGLGSGRGQRLKEDRGPGGGSDRV